MKYAEPIYNMLDGFIIGHAANQSEVTAVLWHYLFRNKKTSVNTHWCTRRINATLDEHGLQVWREERYSPDPEWSPPAKESTTVEED
jgi:hypothetical protein